MAAPLDAVERDEHGPRRSACRWTSVGVVNDAAYGIPAGTLGDALVVPPRQRSSTPTASARTRETVSVAVIQDVEHDAFVTFVATLPAYRGERLASRVLAHALHEAEAARADHDLAAGLQARPVDLRAPRLPRARRDPPLRERPRASTPRSQEAKFCPRCGQPADVAYPRSISCPHCGYGAYYNPKPVAAAIPVTPDNKIVLLRRGFDPGKGLWTFPGGFVDLGETVEEAARREAREEIEVSVELGALVGVYSRDEERVVLIVYAATTTEAPQTTDEAPEVRAFAPDEIPWEELAFWSTTNALKDFLSAGSR